MEKAEDAVRTIGEISLQLDIKPHILRYWEEQFPMLQPLKRSGGRRYYRTDDVALLRQIDELLNREGYTIKGARKLLKKIADNTPPKPTKAAKNTGKSEGSAIASPASLLSNTMRGELEAIRRDLQAALGSA